MGLDQSSWPSGPRAWSRRVSRAPRAACSPSSPARGALGVALALVAGAGRAAGVATVAASYGYLGPDADIARWPADAVIDRPAELLKLIDLA